MKTKPLLYTCNVTIDITQYNSQVPHINRTLNFIHDTLKELSIVGVFFVDIEMITRIQESHPKIYQEIIHTLRKIMQSQHSVALLINPAWEENEDLHVLERNRLLDLAAHGKFFLNTLYGVHLKKPPIIRVLHGKLQPFAALQDIYQFLSIKMDSSIFPTIKHSAYFDFSAIQQGEITRFTKNPNLKDRIGSYIEIPRAILKISLYKKFRFTKQIAKIHYQDPEATTTILDQTKTKPSIIPIQYKTSTKYIVVSPDMFSLYSFKKNHAGTI